MPIPHPLRCLRVTLLFALCFFTHAAFAQTDLPVIDSLISRTMQAQRIPGLSLGIVRNGQILYMKGYGTRTKGKDEPVDSLTNFLTCSISKLFTASGIMQLAEEGQIDISKKLTDYLPEFRMKDPRYQDITIRQILTHTSGLPNIARKHFIRPAHDSLALTLFTQKLSRKKLSFPPGVQLSAKTYSNTGYDILGRVIEKVSGQHYSDYINEKVLQPAGLLHSSFFIDSIPADRRSTPHARSWITHQVHPSGYYPDIPQDKPCGNLNSNSYDLCQWMLHNLSIYKGTTSTGVLKRSTLEEMWTTHAFIPPHETSIGLGWWVVHSKKYGKYLFHVGNDPGFCATLILSPANDFGLVILCNALHPKEVVWNDLAFRIIDQFSAGWIRMDDKKD